MIRLGIIIMSLTMIALSGCVFIVKDGHVTKYYGIDEKRGSEYVNQIFEKQQQVYQAQEFSVGSKKP